MLRYALDNYFTTNIGKDYFNEKVFPPYKSQLASNKEINIIKEVKKRIKQSSYLQNNNDGFFFWFLDLTILIELYENSWDKYTNKLFHDNANKEQIISSLKDVKYFRNDIAHNRLIKGDSLIIINNARLLLEKKMKKKYLKSFLNTTEHNFDDLRKQISESLINIKSQIEKRIKIKDIDNFRQLFSVLAYNFEIYRDLRLIKVNEEEKDIIDLFIDYNRIDSRIDYGTKLRSFIRKNKIIDGIDEIMGKLEHSI